MSAHQRLNIEALLIDNDALSKTNKRLREALTLFRNLVNEGGIPRYSVTPGAALNSLMEEVVDPLLKESGDG